ncbi:hypothetical protein PIB30_090029 [Stylosanthes scabra]|uniref:Uncharacterized protein n=1 Tax=Stylosanthes scabra TaxID=79078 RepID=A0ABU6XUE3_9FABA|nr:hypothetical protein [Stylosanthes scabra]
MYQTQSQSKPHLPESTLCLSLYSGFSFNSVGDLIARWSPAMAKGMAEAGSSAKGDDVQRREEEDVKEYVDARKGRDERRRRPKQGSTPVPSPPAICCFAICRGAKQGNRLKDGFTPKARRFSPRIHRGSTGCRRHMRRIFLRSGLLLVALNEAPSMWKWVALSHCRRQIEKQIHDGIQLSEGASHAENARRSFLKRHKSSLFHKSLHLSRSGFLHPFAFPFDAYNEKVLLASVPSRRWRLPLWRLRTVEHLLDDGSDDSLLDDELEFLARKLRRLMKSKGRNRKSSSRKEYKKKKMKVLMEYWKDLENESDSEDEDEQEAQVCFMADNEVIEVPFNELSNEDLQVVIDNLIAHANKLFEKYNKCKYENATLKNEIVFLKEKLKEIEVAADLLEENRFLKSEFAKFKGKQPVSASTDFIAENERLCGVIEDLKQNLEQFTKSSNNLDKLLSYQIPTSMKSGLDYSAGSNANLKTIFVKAEASTSNTRNQPPQFFHKRPTRGNHCSNCNRQGHTHPQCFVVERKIGDRIYKVVSDFNALGKPRRTNVKGSKAIWIPKVS